VLKIEIDQTGAKPKERLTRALLTSLEMAINRHVKKSPNGTIAVAYVSDAKMKKLNAQYRDKDQTTDVLSFSYLHEGSADSLGDVIISVPQAKRQALGSLRAELCELITHGILHVLGYDHEKPVDAKKMLPLQDKIVGSIL
jgi:probable rRNA maturation factor